MDNSGQVFRSTLAVKLATVLKSMRPAAGLRILEIGTRRKMGWTIIDLEESLIAVI